MFVPVVQKNPLLLQKQGHAVALYPPFIAKTRTWMLLPYYPSFIAKTRTCCCLIIPLLSQKQGHAVALLPLFYRKNKDMLLPYYPSFIAKTRTCCCLITPLLSQKQGHAVALLPFLITKTRRCFCLKPPFIVKTRTCCCRPVCRWGAGGRRVGMRSPSWADYFKIMQFFTRNWAYTPNFGLKIRIFLRFVPPFVKPLNSHPIFQEESVYRPVLSY